MVDETTKEIAKAVTESAKTSGKAIDAAKQLGEFADNVFGSILKDSVGLFADRLAYFRWERAFLLRDRVEKKLKDRGIDTTRAVPVNIGLPLIEKASVEENDDLHTLWSNLLANALDPSYRNEIRRSFVTILAELEPIDAALLDRIFKFVNAGQRSPMNTPVDTWRLFDGMNDDREVLLASLQNLFRLGLVESGTEGNVQPQVPEISIIGPRPPEIHGVFITALGNSFQKAISA